MAFADLALSRRLERVEGSSGVHFAEARSRLFPASGELAAAAALSLHDGVALFAGAATVPEHRRRGLQAALLAERMHYALEQGYDLAMMVAEAGSSSQHNAERQGFRIAYTRLKWKRAQ